jgi:hypothetical protein
MIYLGAERKVTQSYKEHGYAEDYAGKHRSNIKINGYGKVIEIVNKYISHEDSIKYDDYLKYKNEWKDGNYYNCISITGKTVRMSLNELGGNHIFIETYKNDMKLILKLYHLTDVYVKVGDTINPNTIIGTQGSTGLVASLKDIHDITYGSHVHLELRDINNQTLDPNPYAIGLIITSLNPINITKPYLEISADKINIRSNANEKSTDIGDVYKGEIYKILDIIDSQIYIWYKIIVNDNIGYVASQKGSNWTILLDELPVIPQECNYIMIFKALKDDTYYIKLNQGDELYMKKEQ